MIQDVYARDVNAMRKMEWGTVYTSDVYTLPRYHVGRPDLGSCASREASC